MSGVIYLTVTDPMAPWQLVKPAFDTLDKDGRARLAYQMRQAAHRIEFGDPDDEGEGSEPADTSWRGETR